MRLKAIMFTDRQGWTEHASQRGERSRDFQLEWQDKVTLIASSIGGKVVKSLGDGHLITFDCVFDAVRAGKLLQDQVGQYNKGRGEGEQIHLRIGIDAGDVLVKAEDNDVIGNPVDMAKRIESRARPGDVLISERANFLLRSGYAECEPFEEPVTLEGDNRPTRLYRLKSCEIEGGAARDPLSKHLTKSFLQVLIRSFTLQNERGRKHLTVEVTRELEVVTSSNEKQSLEKELTTHQAERDRLAQDLKRVADQDGPAHTVINCKQWPLRYANGGVLPIIENGGRRYFCLFYRERRPRGWNIANGASDSVDEMLNPVRISRREFGEELLICSRNRRVIYAHNPGKENKAVGYQNGVIAGWHAKRPSKGYRNHALKDFPAEGFSWIEGPDSVTAVVPGFNEPQCTTTEKVFVSITPDDNAIEIDRIALVKLDEEFDCLDGELFEDGTPVGRIIGLFEVEGMKKNLAGVSFLPDRVFYDGVERNRGDFEAVLQSYRERVPQHLQGTNATEVPLCPITRAIITRFFSLPAQC